MRKTYAPLIVLVIAVATLSALPNQLAAHPAPPVERATLQFQTPAANTSQPAEHKVTAYTLPPDLYKKAHGLGSISFRLGLIGFVYGLIIFWIVLHFRLSAKFRDWAESVSSNAFLQACFFTVPVVLTIAILRLPLRMYGHRISFEYGLSVQHWPSWFADWTKSQLLFIALAICLVWILYSVIRRSPRHWWFYFWLISLPITVLLVFIQPLVVDPLFNKFEPLASKDPRLTASLEQMVQRAGEDIPPERIFWMGASEKTTALNAYVTGVGASKRIVVWDTTIAKMNTPQIVTVAGHEMGHYVLNHVLKGLVFAALGLFLLFYLGYRCMGWLLSRWGDAWRIHSVSDFASLPALLLLFWIFAFAADPISNAYSRHIEHQADQYALEVCHGLIADSGQVAAQAEQILGEVDLSDPDPYPVDVFLFYTHPPTADRIRFELTYDPWSTGGHGEFVP